MPKAAPTPCRAARCRNYATNGGYCDDHQKERKSRQWDHGGKNRHDRGYGWKWEKTRKQALERDDYLCQPCKDQGIFTKADAVDHIKPRPKAAPMICIIYSRYAILVTQ